MKRTILSRFPQIDARSLFLIVVVTCPALFGASDPWNQFRGPNGSGVSETMGLPVRFGPNTNLVRREGHTTSFFDLVASLMTLLLCHFFLSLSFGLDLTSDNAGQLVQQ
jgi:hypothetical protein